MPYAIATDNLGRRFGDRWAVSHLTFEVERGEVFGLLGPNGAGKTTTMRMLASLIAPSVGRAHVGGYDVVRQARDVRRHVGIMTESPGLYENLTAYGNLRFFSRLYDIPPRQAGAQIEHYLRLFELWDRRDDIAGTFSKGMKQKLGLARALLHDPQVVILDEPTSALDPEGAKLVRDCIVSLREEGHTILLCTHNLFEAQSLCDRVAIVKGRLLRVGTPRELQEALYGRNVEVQVANARPGPVPGSDQPPAAGGITMNDLALIVSTVPGVGDVVVSGNKLVISAMEPDDTTPGVVRALVKAGADVLRVAEVEYSLEMAYLDLVARHADAETQAPAAAHSEAVV